MIVNHQSQCVPHSKDLHPAHEAQLVNYLKAIGIEVGLLLNFGERVGIKRKVFTPPKDCSQ